MLGLMLAFIAFAMIGGAAAQLAWPLQQVALAAADVPCDMGRPAAGHGVPMLPCKGMTPGCIKQMGCVVEAALPARLASADVSVPFSAVDYWSTQSDGAGVVHAPEPLPPRTT